MPIQSLRGAITVPDNTHEAIRDATTEMLEALINQTRSRATTSFQLCSVPHPTWTLPTPRKPLARLAGRRQD